MGKVLKNTKLIYLFFGFLPLVFYLLSSKTSVVDKDYETHTDYFYFSAGCSAKGEIWLESDTGLIAKWQLDQGNFKNLQYVGQIPRDSLVLSFHHFMVYDTVSLCALNAYCQNKLYSLLNISDNDYVAENGQIAVKDGALFIQPIEIGKPVILKFKPLMMWDEENEGGVIDLFIIILIVILFFVLYITFPGVKPFVLSLIITLLFVMSFKIIIPEKAGSIEISTHTVQTNAELFYNRTPFFNSEKKFVFKEESGIQIPINLSVDRYLRFDPDEEVKKIKDLNIKVKTGLFSFNISPLSSPHNFIFNDLKSDNDFFVVCGNDPYISFSTLYFLNKLNKLIKLEKYLVLLIGLLLFFVLLIIFSFFKFTDKLRVKWYYLYFLLLPLSYLIIILFFAEKKNDEGNTHIYFSLRSTQTAVISLINGHDTLAVWENDSKGFRYFHYKGKTESGLPLSIGIDGLEAEDTVSILSVNLYENGEVYNLYDNEEHICHVTNARHTEDVNSSSVIIIEPHQPVIINLLPFHAKERNNEKGYIYILIIIMFLIIFLYVVVSSPLKSYFIAICITVSFFMFVYFWVGHHWQSHLTLETTSPLKSVQFFYSPYPEFIHDKKNDINSNERLFKTEIELFDNNFLRCDIVDSICILENLNISLKTGIIGKHWNYRTIAPEHVLLNDMLRIGDVYHITGEDPFIVLSSSYQWQSINLLTYVCQNIFILLTLIVFTLLIFLKRYLNKYSLSEVILVLVFIMSITYSFFFFLFTSHSIILSAEMRYAHTLPEYNKDSLSTYLEETENYLNDQLPGRTNIIIMNNLIEYNLFGQIINNPNVHFGKDGWMFYVGGVCRENFENSKPLSDEELEKMTEVLVKRRDWLNKRGIEFYMMFPPMAYFVYEEEVGPRLWRYHKKSKVEQLYEYVNTNTDINFIDLLEPLKEAKKNNQRLLYFKTNSHWNYNGSYIAYTTLIEYLKRDFPQIPAPFPYDSIRWKRYDTYIPDLYKALALDRYNTSVEYEPVRAFMLRDVETTYPVYEGFSSPAPAFCLHNKNVESPSILLYGDSYAGFLYYYLAQNFSRGIYLWTPLFYPSIIELEKPDIVVQEMNDYSIMNLLYPNPPLTE